MSFAIREATIDDYEALSPLYAEADAFHAAALPDIFRAPAGASWSREHIAALLASGEAMIYIAEREGKLIGLVQITIEQAPAYPVSMPRRWVKVNELVVLPAARRAGVASALMAQAEQWARQRGLADLELNVWEFNTGARKLYEQLGYDTMSRRMHKRLGYMRGAADEPTIV